MIFLLNFVLFFHLVLHSRTENVLPPLEIKSIHHNGEGNAKTLNLVNKIHQDRSPREALSLTEANAVPYDVSSQLSRQERAIDQFPPHKAFHEFHGEPVRPRVPGRRRPTRPPGPLDNAAPRRFPEGEQRTSIRTARPTSSTKRTRRPVTTKKHSPVSDFHPSKTTKPLDSRTTRRRRPTTPSTQDLSSRPTSRPRTSGATRPLRTSGATRGTRRPSSTKPPDYFPPHKAFHEFHHEQIKPRRTGARRRTTTPSHPTRLPDLSVTEITKVTTRKLTTSLAKVSHKPSPDTTARTSRARTHKPGGRRVTQRRKTTPVAAAKPTKYPGKRGPANGKPGIDASITSTTRPSVTRRHTDRGQRHTKKPTSAPPDYTRSATHSQAITKNLLSSSKPLPPHKAFHDFHFDSGRTRILEPKTSVLPTGGTTPPYQTPISKSTKPQKYPERRTTTRSQKERASSPPGRKRTTIAADQNSRPHSTTRQKRPSTRPQQVFDVTQKLQPTSPSPRRFPHETRGPDSTSKPLPPHKAFHEFHFQPVRPRISGRRRTNDVSKITTKLALPSQYSTGVTERPKSTPSLSQDIWPRIPGGDRFITKSPVPSTPPPVVPVYTTKPSSRSTVRQRQGTTSVRKQTTSRRPSGKRRKPTAATKRKETTPLPPKEEKVQLTPFQSTYGSREKPTRGTTIPQSISSRGRGVSSSTSKPLPPHKAFHEFHFDAVRPKIPNGSGRRKTTSQPPRPAYTTTGKPHTTSTLLRGIQPRIPGGDQIVVTYGITSTTQKPVTSRRRTNGKSRKPTSASPEHRQPTERRPLPPAIPETPRARVHIETPPREPGYRRPSYPSSEKPVTSGVQRKKTLPSSDKKTLTTAGATRRTKPRYPGDRGTYPTAAIVPEDGRRSTRARIPSDRGSTDQPIKVPPHRAFHEFHYAPVRPRFLSGT